MKPWCEVGQAKIKDCFQSGDSEYHMLKTEKATSGVDE